MTKPSALRRKDLRRLRTLLEKRESERLPMEELTALAELPPNASVTIDFEAAYELGHPLVVLRPKYSNDSNALDLLSRREREVASLVADGLSNKEIAECLFISLGTVKDHVHRILEKTGYSNRTTLALAVRSSENVYGA